MFREDREIAQDQASVNYYVKPVVYEEESSGCCGGGCDCGSHVGKEHPETWREDEMTISFAWLDEGDTALVLGSGSGTDCFIARELVGESGKVIGVEPNEELVEQARKMAAQLHFNNVEFRHCSFDRLAACEKNIDVLIANDVLDHLDNKIGLLKEAYRVMKHHGHMTMNLTLFEGEMPPALKEDADLYAGTTSGSMNKETLFSLIEAAGFEEIQILQASPFVLPEGMLKHHLNEENRAKYDAGEFGLYHVTISVSKECCHKHDHAGDHHTCGCGNH